MRCRWQLIVLTILIFLIALWTRLFLLSSIPTVFSHDEMGYVINALSVALTGTGKTGIWQALSLTPVEAHLAELPALFIAPFFHLVANNLVAARLVFVLMSLTLPIFIAGICLILSKSKKAAYLSLVIALFNPWLWQNGRLAFDASFSLWFYVLGIFLFLRKNNAWRLLSLLPFFLGFYCYQGFKILLPFIGIALVLFSFWQAKQVKDVKKPLFLNLIFIFSIFLLFIFYLTCQLPQQAASLNRIDSQLLLPGSEQIATIVNQERRLTLSSIWNQFFINKYTQFIKEMFNKLLYAFGSRELFFEINASGTSFAVWNHGIFYLLDAVFLLLGLLVFLKKKNYASLALLGAFILIGTLPVLMTNSLWLFFRSAFIIPFFLIFIGVGWLKIAQFNRKLFILCSLIYVVSMINFAFNYFYRYPLFASEGIFFSPRIVADYARRVPVDHKLVVFDHEPDFVFTSYIFYNELFNQESAAMIQKIYQSKNYELQNVAFHSCVPNDLEPEKNVTYIFAVDVDYCEQKSQVEENVLAAEFLYQAPLLYIKQIKDSGDNYVIYQDHICENYEQLNNFINPQSLNTFAFASLSNDSFCQNWLTRRIN
jgi:hypothetical protein